MPFHPAYAQKRPSPPQKRHTLAVEKVEKRDKRKINDGDSVEFVDDWDSVVSTAGSNSRPSVARRMTDWITRKDPAPASDAESEFAETESSYGPNRFYAQTPSTAPSTVPSNAPSATASEKNTAETSSVSSFWPFGGQTSSSSPPANAVATTSEPESTEECTSALQIPQPFVRSNAFFSEYCHGQRPSLASQCHGRLGVPQYRAPQDDGHSRCCSDHRR